MNNTDLITILGNVSKSIQPLESLIAGAGYVVGIIFIMSSLIKIKEQSGSSSSHESMVTPFAYLICGAALLYLPTMLHILSDTVFGTGNILQYATFHKTDFYSSIKPFIQLAGILWFVRGCVLIAHASDGGERDGPKGLMFIIGGVFAVNFTGTIGMLDFMLQHLMLFTGIKATQ